MLPVVHIFSFIITIYLKKLLGIKSHSTNQFPAKLYPWIIPLYFPSYQKCSPSLHLVCWPHHVWTELPLSPNLPFELSKFPKQNFQSPSAFFSAIWKTLLQLLLFSFLLLTFFISILINFLWSHSSCNCIV